MSEHQAWQALWILAGVGWGLWVGGWLARALTPRWRRCRPERDWFYGPRRQGWGR